jgi:hypothetical protein
MINGHNMCYNPAVTMTMRRYLYGENRVETAQDRLKGESIVIAQLNLKGSQSFLFNNECTSDCLKNNIKIHIKIAPACFGAEHTTSPPTKSYTGIP